MKTEQKSELITGFILALILVLTVQFSSCISPKRIAKICETCPTETKDSIVRIETEKVIYKAGALDSLMWVSTFDFSQFTDTIFKTDTVIKFKDNQWSFQLIRDHDKLKLYATHQSDSIKELQKMVDNTQVKTVTKTVEKTVPKYNRFFYFLLIWWLISLIFVAVWIWWQYQKGVVRWNIFKIL
jgi:ATP-dependent Zn protease